MDTILKGGECQFLSCKASTTLFFYYEDKVLFSCNKHAKIYEGKFKITPLKYLECAPSKATQMYTHFGNMQMVFELGWEKTEKQEAQTWLTDMVHRVQVEIQRYTLAKRKDDVQEVIRSSENIIKLYETFESSPALFSYLKLAVFNEPEIINKYKDALNSCSAHSSGLKQIAIKKFQEERKAYFNNLKSKEMKIQNLQQSLDQANIALRQKDELLKNKSSEIGHLQKINSDLKRKLDDTQKWLDKTKQQKNNLQNQMNQLQSKVKNMAKNEERMRFQQKKMQEARAWEEQKHVKAQKAKEERKVEEKKKWEELKVLAEKGKYPYKDKDMKITTNSGSSENYNEELVIGLIAYATDVGMNSQQTYNYIQPFISKMTDDNEWWFFVICGRSFRERWYDEGKYTKFKYKGREWEFGKGWSDYFDYDPRD